MIVPTALDWDAFDPERYLEHNYRKVLAPDRWLFLHLIDDVKGAVAEHPDGSSLRAADVGTGPNLYPVLAVAPYVVTAEILEVGAANRRYLLRQLTALDPVWQQWIALARESGQDFDQEAAVGRMRVGSTSILELPVAAYDLVTSFFCAESFTDERSVFAAACESLAMAARPSGLVAAAFMLGSTGYDTAGCAFPAVPIQRDDLAEVFRPLLTNLRIESVPHGGDVRAGYAGMAYVTGRRR